MPCCSADKGVLHFLWIACGDDVALRAGDPFVSAFVCSQLKITGCRMRVQRARQSLPGCDQWLFGSVKEGRSVALASCPEKENYRPAIACDCLARRVRTQVWTWLPGTGNW